MNIPDFYERHADDWFKARSMSDFFERKYIDRVLFDRPKGSAVLDVGCGTGFPIAEHVLAQGAPLTGCDVSPAMIAKARARSPRGEWIVADMRTLDLGRKFGAVIAWDSFFHLTRDEQRGVLPRFRAHLAPDGILLFTSGPQDGEQIGAMYGEALYHASLSPEEYRRILGDLGFTRIDFTPKDTDCGNHSVWVAR